MPFVSFDLADLQEINAMKNGLRPSNNGGKTLLIPFGPNCTNPSESEYMISGFEYSNVKFVFRFRHATRICIRPLVHNIRLSKDIWAFIM